MNLKWKPSEDGFTETHCGRFQISPIYWGRCNACGYHVSYENVKISTQFDTQREAKAHAQFLEDHNGFAQSAKAAALAIRKPKRAAGASGTGNR